MKKLEWYVLNKTGNYQIEPYNVFNNWIFKEDAIKLAEQYKKGKIKEWSWTDDFPKKDLFKQFKYALMCSLSSEERGRCEYEIVVSPLISIPNEDYEVKIDCYEQVKPNEDIFAKYVLMTINGTLDSNPTKKEIKKAYSDMVCALTHNIDVCANCDKCETPNRRLEIIETFANYFGFSKPWRDKK